jgi:hypothetical protein
MDRLSLIALSDEMTKLAGFSDFWKRVKEFFSPPEDRVQKKVDHFFSPKAGVNKWDKLVRESKNQKFVDILSKSPLADDRLKQHTQSMHDLANGAPVGRVRSDTLPGKSYEIRKMTDGTLGCQCGDWRYKGSVTPGYECKHVKAHLAGMSKVALSFSDLTAAFFDEIDKVEMDKQLMRENGYDLRTDRPYSSMLTQDEEPLNDYSPNQVDFQEFEVITRSGT